MKSKKFMLAGLVLLAITMVLLPLSGCKNDTVPPEVEKQEQEDGGGSETDKNDTVPETPKYQVTFNVGVNSEATAPASITVESGTKLTAEQVKPLADTDTYSFVGWFDQTKKRVSAGDEITGDVELTAFWVLNKWLSFTCDDETHLEVQFRGEVDVPEGMEYSTDGNNWTPITKTQPPIPFGRGTNLYLRAKSPVGTEIPRTERPYTYGVNYVQFAFEEDTKVQAAGDIRTLVDWENPTEVNTSNARFAKLFMDCDELVTAPELPAAELARNCYAWMFSGCTGLTQAPELPATELAINCYTRMFSGCTNLTQAPELPATKLAGDCYANMFSGCTSLTQAPELLAETLADRCYVGMFSGCTSLTQAPELPAPELAESCYTSMFSGCTSLTQAPELPAKTLAEHCYWHMFSGCENLSSVTMLATDVSALSALYDWLKDTAEGGTLYVASGMETDEEITGSLPTGWTVEVAATN